MPASMDFRIAIDNTGKVGEELELAIVRALEICGGKAETYAKLNCPVDTGLLRNSITHAVEGNAPSVQSYKANKGDAQGSYSGSIGKKGDHTVYVGSNVSYAADNELHHKTKSGFIRHSLENHMEEYKTVIQSELSR